MAAVPVKDICSGIESKTKMDALIAANTANDTLLGLNGYVQSTFQGKQIYTRTASGTKHLQCDALDQHNGVI